MTSKLRRAIALAVLPVIAIACASGGASSGASAAPQGEQGASRRANNAVITAEQLRDTKANNLLDAVRILHPDWLKRSAASSITSNQDQSVSVYVDNIRVGGAEVLQQTSITSATSVRYYTASEAQTRFGTGNQNGAIQVLTTSGKP